MTNFGIINSGMTLGTENLSNPKRFRLKFGIKWPKLVTSRLLPGSGNYTDGFSGLDDQVYIDLNTEFRRQRFYDAWPHQTVKEKVLSQIFFPQELKDLNESPSALYFRDHILYRLAYAAKNNDLLALYYICIIV